MLQALSELSLLSIMGIVAAIALAALLIYMLTQRLPARRRGGERPHPHVRPDPFSADRGTAPRPARDPRTLGRIRGGREGDRPSEDDITRARMGARGLPGEAAPAPAIDESITQIPKDVDPGHTA